MTSITPVQRNSARIGREDRLRGSGCYSGFSGLECMLISIKNVCHHLISSPGTCQKVSSKPSLIKSVGMRNGMSTKTHTFHYAGHGRLCINVTVKFLQGMS